MRYAVSTARSLLAHLALATGLTVGTPVVGQDSLVAFDSNGNQLLQMAASVLPPAILGQPQNQIVVPGDSASFAVCVSDTRALSYQWRFNGTNLIGATRDALMLTNVSAANEGPYVVVLANGSGSVTSAPALLMMDSDGDGLPDSWEQMFFGSLGQSATGDADGDGVSNLQEFLDGTNPTNSLSALFRITLLSDGGTVAVVPDQAAYTNGASVTLTASDPFHAWTGDVLTRSNSITLTMTNNKMLFAHFGPVTFTWTNTVSGDWNSASNWTPNLVPGSNDSVYITLANSIVGLNTNADLADFTLGDGFYQVTFNCNSTLTIRGKFSWNSGDQSGSGRTIVEAGGSLAIANPSTVSLTTRTLENGGAATWSGNGSAGLNNAVITNRPGATFDVIGSSPVVTGGGASRFDNAGTFRKFSPGTTSFSSVPFNNYNSAQIQAGTLSLDGGGLNNGTMTVSAGTSLILGLGPFTANASSSITGAGQFTVNGASGTLAGLVYLTGTNTFANGTVNLTGNYICTNNTLAISGGTANFDGTGTISPAIVTLSGGTLGGSNAVTVGGAMNWTGGAMSGSGRIVISPAAALNINSPPLQSLFLTTRTLENAGTSVWTGAGNLGFNGGVITNRAGALFDASGSGSMSGSSRFENAGTFRKLSAGTTGLITFNNYNLLQIQSGILSLDGGGLNNGTMTVSAGTSLILGPGAFAANASSSITGAGQFTVNGASGTLAGLAYVTGTNTFANGTVNLTGNYICTNNTLAISGGTANFDGTGTISPAIVTLSGGTLGGSNAVTVGGAMNWTGGAMSGSGRIVISPAAALNINSPPLQSLLLTTRTLENAGTSAWTGAGNLGLNNAVITNRPGALFDIQNASSVSFFGGAPRLDNAGTLRKSASTGTATIGIPFGNFGTVDIRNGTLAANSGYVSSSNALLACTLGGTTPGTNFGLLQVNGSVTLNGGLGVVLASGYAPNPNDSFAVVTSTARNGAFASLSYPSNQVTMELSNTPTSVLVRVTATAATPPLLFTPMLAGSNVLLTWSAVSNSTYRLEFNPTLAPSNWSGLPGDVLSTGSTASKLDALTPSNRFYRVRVLP